MDLGNSLISAPSVYIEEAPADLSNGGCDGSNSGTVGVRGCSALQPDVVQPSIAALIEFVQNCSNLHLKLVKMQDF